MADILEFRRRLRKPDNVQQSKLYARLDQIELELWPCIMKQGEKHAPLYIVMALMELATSGVETLAQAHILGNNEIARLRDRFVRDINAIMGEGE